MRVEGGGGACMATVARPQSRCRSAANLPRGFEFRVWDLSLKRVWVLGLEPISEVCPESLSLGFRQGRQSAHSTSIAQLESFLEYSCCRLLTKIFQIVWIMNIINNDSFCIPTQYFVQLEAGVGFRVTAWACMATVARPQSRCRSAANLPQHFHRSTFVLNSPLFISAKVSLEAFLN